MRTQSRCIVRRKVIALLCAVILSLSWGTAQAQPKHEDMTCAAPLPDESFRMSSPYGPRLHPLSHTWRFHEGIDLACPRGTSVYAAYSGAVVFAGRWGCYGNALLIRHPGDVMTLYAHLSRIAKWLRPGLYVRKGERIALSGASGCVTGPHLHFEVWKNGHHTNPAFVCGPQLRLISQHKEKTNMVVIARDYAADMDAPLLQLSRQKDFLTQRQSFSATHYWGLIGGGKTTSAKMQAGAYLRAGYGGYVTAVKHDEVELWIRYCEQHGRMNSLFLFDDGEGFNFLDYQMALQGLDGINTTVEALMTVVESTRLGSGGSNRGGDAFWSDSPRVPLRNGLPILYAAKGALSVPDILRFIATAPQSPQEVTSREWQGRSFMYEMMNRAVNAPKVRIPPASLEHIINFWREQWASTPSKTTGNIVMTLTAALDRFNHGRLNRVFCGKTTVVPEMSFGGAVIVDAKPTLTWNEDGIIAQRLFKFFWQRAVLSRNSLAPQYRERPLFNWNDEGQETVLPADGDFLGLCRQSKCAVTSLSQSIPAYVSRIGGDNPREAALSLAGKFGNHVFCSNSDNETNEFASKMLGRVITRHGNYSQGDSRTVNVGMSAGSNQNWGSSSSYGSSYGGNSFSSSNNSGSTSGSGNNWGENRGRGNTRNENRGYSESMEYAIEPGDFARYLKTGGPQNGNRVSAVWFQAGRTFKATGTNYLIPEFQQ